MNPNVFDWDTVLEGEVDTDGIDYRWKRGNVKVVFGSELPEMLVFIDPVTLAFVFSDEVRGLVALLKGEVESALLSNELEICPGISSTLSIGGDLDPVQIGFTHQEVASIIEGVTALLPYMEAGELWRGDDENVDEEPAAAQEQ